MLLNEVYNKDFSSKLTRRLSANILLATDAFNKFTHENRSYFSHPNHAAILSSLLHCGIEKSLYDLAFSSEAPYQCILKTVNNFKHTINEMKTENFIFTSAKTFKSGQLPSKSKYKINYAQENSGAGGQLYFDFSPEPIIASPPFYALLTYGYNKLTKECSHITIVVPDSSFEYSILTTPLSTSKDLINIIPSLEQEETIVNLHSEFEEQIVKLKDNK